MPLNHRNQTPTQEPWKWEDLKFNPLGLQDLHRCLNVLVKEPGHLTFFQSRFDTSDVAWSVYGASKDEAHRVKADSFFPGFLALCAATQIGDPGEACEKGVDLDTGTKKKRKERSDKGTKGSGKNGAAGAALTRIDAAVTRIDAAVTRIDAAVTRIDAAVTRIDAAVTRRDAAIGAPPPTFDISCLSSQKLYIPPHENIQNTARLSRPGYWGLRSRFSMPAEDDSIPEFSNTVSMSLIVNDWISEDNLASIIQYRLSEPKSTQYSSYHRSSLFESIQSQAWLPATNSNLDIYVSMVPMAI
ncbi:hypothetical protein C8R44DRAFT_741889 [Mycena epipterygia]|nr:hypothetical protein C8R44DRAFT_741889 [Mycena epipterygia]